MHKGNESRTGAVARAWGCRIWVCSRVEANLGCVYQQLKDKKVKFSGVFAVDFI